jgi:hypothetical protein
VGSDFFSEFIGPQRLAGRPPDGSHRNHQAPQIDG